MINDVLKSQHEPVGKLKDFFYRVEFQQRGSPHIHMLAWIDGAPKIPKKNSEDEIIAFVDKYLSCSSEDPAVAELIQLQVHKHSKTCRTKGQGVCRFGFPLPPLPRTMILHPLDKNVERYKKMYSENTRKNE